MGKIEDVSLDPNDFDDIEINDPDNPGWMQEGFANARPAREALGDEVMDRWAARREAQLVEPARLNADLEDLVRAKRCG